MKLNDLIHTLEINRKSVSESKVKVAYLLTSNNIDFLEKDKKKFDLVINNINKMITSAFAGIKYKIKIKPYHDDSPFFIGAVNLNAGYNLETELSVCSGNLSKVKNELDKLAVIDNLFDPNTMSRVVLKNPFNVAREDAVKALSSSLRTVNGLVDSE